MRGFSWGVRQFQLQRGDSVIHGGTRWVVRDAEDSLGYLTITPPGDPETKRRVHVSEVEVFRERA